MSQAPRDDDASDAAAAAGAASGGPLPGPLPGPLRFAAAVGALEALLLVGYGISVAVFPLVGRTSGVSEGAEVAGPVLAAILIVFGVLVALVVRGLLHRRAAARVPFFLVQAFTVIGAWPLATGALVWEWVLGIGLVVLAAASAYVALSPSGAAALDR